MHQPDPIPICVTILLYRYSPRDQADERGSVDRRSGFGMTSPGPGGNILDLDSSAD